MSPSRIGENFEKFRSRSRWLQFTFLRRLTTFNDLNWMNNDSFRCILKSVNCHAYQAYYFRTLITVYRTFLNLVTNCNLILRDDVSISVVRPILTSKLKKCREDILLKKEQLHKYHF